MAAAVLGGMVVATGNKLFVREGYGWPEPNTSQMTLRSNVAHTVPSVATMTSQRRSTSQKPRSGTSSAPQTQSRAPSIDTTEHDAKAWAQHVVQGRSASFEPCLSDEAKLNPKMPRAHKMIVHFGKRGYVRGAFVVSASTSPALSACLTRTAKRMVVPDDAPKIPDEGVSAVLALQAPTT